MLVSLLTQWTRRARNLTVFSSWLVWGMVLWLTNLFKFKTELGILNISCYAWWQIVLPLYPTYCLAHMVNNNCGCSNVDDLFGLFDQGRFITAWSSWARWAGFLCMSPMWILFRLISKKGIAYHNIYNIPSISNCQCNNWRHIWQQCGANTIHEQMDAFLIFYLE